MILKRFCFFCITAASVVGIQRFCHKQTDGFALYKIQSDLSFHPQWEASASSLEEIETLKQNINQPFHYLSKGAQSYVFVSQDDKYVIKFFRLYHLMPPAWIEKITWPVCMQRYRLEKILKKRQELGRDFESYKIAYEQMKEETGLLFIHLNKGQGLNQKIKLFDKLNICHEIDLDKMEFLVQKKAELVYPAIDKMVDEQGIETAKIGLSNLVDLLISRREKGIDDKDPDLNTNFGFIGQRALQIDIGRFRKNNDQSVTLANREEIIRITDNLNQWLRACHPLLSQHLEKKIEQLPSSEI